jgi:hypothetical protein
MCGVQLVGKRMVLRDLPGVFPLDAFMRHGFTVMYDDLHTVNVRIFPAWARWVGEKVWHESQRAEKQADGSLILTFQVAGLDEIKRWVLSLGPGAVVLEPITLRNAIVDDLESLDRGRQRAQNPRVGAKAVNDLLPKGVMGKAAARLSSRRSLAQE